MRWCPEAVEGMLRPGRRKAWESGEGRACSSWLPGAGIVPCPRVTAPPRRSSFHHPASVFPQELNPSTCWDVPTASRGEGRTRAGVEPPAPLPLQCFTGHGTSERSWSPRWLLVLLEQGTEAAHKVPVTLHPDPGQPSPVTPTPRSEILWLVMVHPEGTQEGGGGSVFRGGTLSPQLLNFS